MWLFVFVLAFVWVPWMLWIDHTGSRRNEEKDEEIRTLRRMLCWHTERIGRLEIELDMQARKRFHLQRSFQSTGAL